MKKIVLVSLIHNREHLLRPCILSALRQTLSREKWCHLLIDNNSTDSAGKIAASFANKFEHVHYVKNNENLGQQRAYNWVLNEWLPKNCSTAEVMAVLDSDDMLMPNALSEVLNMFKAHPEIGQTYSGFDIVDKMGRIKHKDHAKAKYIPNQFAPEGQKTIRKIFLKQNPIGHFRAFRIKCLKDIGGFNTQYQFATDYNIAGRMLMKYPVVKINKVLYQWRQHDKQIERKYSVQQTQDWKDMQKEFAKLFNKKGLV